MTKWDVEAEYAAQGYAMICGADEAGAGPLAGPVYAAAVLLPFGLELPGVNDSKQLTEMRREALFQPIQQAALAWAVASVSPQEIDATDILSARVKAMNMAIQALEPKADFALVDGNRDHGHSAAITLDHATVVKGDGKSMNIAAASILAKVSRDRHMLEMARLYPEYQFEKHKGYGTKLHYEMLERYGPSPIHRKSFLKKFYAREGRA